MSNGYKKRIVDEILERKLRVFGAVLIQGPKWCGKTTTALQKTKSYLFMDESENVEQRLLLSELNPSSLLEGETPRLIDEWQLAPKLWDAIRFTIDRRGGKSGQFVLTGSSTPIKKDQIRHSGAGRFAFLQMRSMSLYESGDSDGSVSLSSLFDAPDMIDGKSSIDLKRLAFLTCRGG